MSAPTIALHPRAVSTAAEAPCYEQLWRVALPAPVLDISEPGVAVVTNVRFQHSEDCGWCRKWVVVHTDGGVIRAQISAGKRPRWQVTERAGADPVWPTECPHCSKPFHRRSYFGHTDRARRERPYCYGTRAEGSAVFQVLINDGDPLDLGRAHVRATADPERLRLADRAASG